jgi:ACS family hexuronate transporter-like MFS transporter
MMAFIQRRWWIVLLLLVATILNYVDRQSLSILATTIQSVFRMSDYAYGNIVFAFLLAYTIAYAFSGPFCDRLGARASMAIVITWWSIAELIPPLVHSAFMLGLSRLLLGMGEAGIWVIAPKAVGQLFPPEQRGTAIGIYTSGAMLGATIAPPLIAFLTIQYGWSSVFFLTGIAGLVWVVPWLLMFRESPDSRESMQTSSGAWHTVLRMPNLWLLLFARMLTDPVWYFYLFWYPKYLSDARHQTLSQVGHIVWVVYFAADAGALVGGWISGRLMRRNMKPLHARRAVMTVAALLLPLSPLVAFAHTIALNTTVAAVIAFAHMTWLISLTALAVDLFPKTVVGTAFGFISAGSGIGGLLSTELIPRIVHNQGYPALFAVMGILHPVALFMIWKLRATSSATIDFQEVLA